MCVDREGRILPGEQRTGVDEGYVERVLTAKAKFVKHRQGKYGGLGFAHLLENIVPGMPEKGFSRDDIETITVRNPARILTLV